MNIINNDLSNNCTIETIENEKKREKKKKTDNCQELKNIAYKTMLQNGNNIITKVEENKNKIHNYLESESKNNKSETWIKLDKTQKIMRLNIYAESLKDKYTLTEKEIEELKKYFIKCLDRKNLSRAKELIYNKESGIIESIPFLFFDEVNRVFLLKKDEKHISTLKSLPSDKKNKPKTLRIYD